MDARHYGTRQSEKFGKREHVDRCGVVIRFECRRAVGERLVDDQIQG